MKVSFIVPVYKVEAYLSKCVESILAQTYKDFEILLVDDGSPDNCPRLCDEWATKDSRIKALHKPNGGLSDARNYGLDHAQGEYVIFVDSDDFWVGKDSLEKLVRLQETNPDIGFVGFNCSYYYPASKTFVKWVEYSDELSVAADKNIVVCKLVKSGTFPMSACLKFVRRDFLICNQLYFIKGQIAEDIPWFINLLDNTQKCLFVNEYIYAYRQNVVGSITASNENKSFASLFDIFITELNKLEKRTFGKEAKLAIKSFLAYEYCILLTYKNKSKSTRQKLYKYKDILKYTMNPKVKLANGVFRMFGIWTTEKVLFFYNRWRTSKK